MNLVWVVLLPLIGTLIPLLTDRFGRNACAFSAAILPAFSLILVLMYAADIFNGEAVRQSIEWIQSMGLDL
jgi:multicomponent K+:H+ antiporter subunit A